MSTTEKERLEELNNEEVQEIEQKKDNLADLLTSKELEKHISDAVDKKLADATDAHDEEEENEEPQEEKKGIGIFPMVLIGGVLAVGAFTLLAKNRPISYPDEQGQQNDG